MWHGCDLTVKQSQQQDSALDDLMADMQGYLHPPRSHAHWAVRPVSLMVHLYTVLTCSLTIRECMTTGDAGLSSEVMSMCLMTQMMFNGVVNKVAIPCNCHPHLWRCAVDSHADQSCCCTPALATVGVHAIFIFTAPTVRYHPSTPCQCCLALASMLHLFCHATCSSPKKY